jgi:hypothetical protein
MKRLAIAVTVAWAVAVGSASIVTMTPSQVQAQEAEDQYEDSVMHPLRLAYFAAHPVGVALEWLVGRPFHYIISRPHLRNLFGYYPPDEEGTYRKLGERL